MIGKDALLKRRGAGRGKFEAEAKLFGAVEAFLPSKMRDDRTFDLDTGGQKRWPTTSAAIRSASATAATVVHAIDCPKRFGRRRLAQAEFDLDGF
ncbi:MAG: hypothetical protein ABIZ49_01980 [Opitutaceae bacterium]